MPEFLDQEIKFLPGVGPKRAGILRKELKIASFRDLIYYYPYKYIDRTKFYKTTEIHADMPYIQVKGVLRSLETVGVRPKERLTARLYDGHGSIELVWFRAIKWQKEHLKLNKEYIVFGKPSVFGGRISVVHPEMETEAEKQLKPLGMFQGYYHTTENMKKNFLNSRAINKLQLTLLNLIPGKIPETLPPALIQQLKLMSLEEALVNIHKPENTADLRKARFRLKFEELFYIQLKILALKHKRDQKFKGFRFEKVGYNFNTFYTKFLPFSLTNAQKKVVREIRRDVNRNVQMNRLLQGDVGSGKTLVALMTMLIAIDNGFQSCLMAPTEILAQQHFQSINKFLNGMNVNEGLLTGSTKAKDRKVIHAELQSGAMQIIAMTVYGDLDVSVIDELPPGRKPIQTMHFYDNRRQQLYRFLKQEIEKGRQAYIVYPLISESEKLDLKNLEEGFRQLSEVFPEYKLSMVHGKMKPAVKENAMQHFKNHDTHIMVATTVIEVGVDVPNASVMVIESAERFGLSQLHQLRGRVGRGAEQSYCILMSSYKLSTESRKRLDTMVRTNDGFEIAEADMKLRGPGDLEGTQQSGMGFDLKIANLSKDGEILQLARNVASDTLDDDPYLEKPEHQVLLRNLLASKTTEFGWSSIS